MTPSHSKFREAPDPAASYGVDDYDVGDHRVRLNQNTVWKIGRFRDVYRF